MAEEHQRAPLPNGADLILVDGSVLEAGGQVLIAMVVNCIEY